MQTFLDSRKIAQLCIRHDLRLLATDSLCSGGGPPRP
jgi:hypothetical protein